MNILDTIIREMHVIYFVTSIGKLTLDYREGGTNHDDVPNILRSCPLLHKAQTIMTPSSLNCFAETYQRHITLLLLTVASIQSSQTEIEYCD